MFRVLACLTEEHDWRLIVIAGVVCFFSSLTAVSLISRAIASGVRMRQIWLVGAGAAAGCGIWATHFIAMLAYDPGIGLSYSIGLTALSLLASTAVTGLGSATAVYLPRNWGAPLGGAIVGLGVASMHYLGMWAIEMPGRVSWSYDLVAASIVLSVLLSAAALTAATYRGRSKTALAAVLLTLAVVLHHFTAMGAVEIVPDPTRTGSVHSLSATLLAVTVASVAISILWMTLVLAFVDGRLRDKQQMKAALDNMSQGLCMWSPAAKLMLCNRRYVEMYGLSPDLARHGSALRELLEHRIRAGSFSGNPDQYIADLLSSISKGKVITDVREDKGRFIAIVNQPLAGGGWVATHEDVTERRLADRQRLSLKQQEERRAAVDTALALFRQRVESMLGVVGNGVNAMRDTASDLLGASERTSQHAKSAVGASHEASANVETAAAAASEMSSSIAEISEQLSRTTEVVRASVSEAETANSKITGLAEAAQKIGAVVKLIRDIAGQTNLLALNATIEAARAGESGRGFAVVASEVKSLAVQTAKATEEIAAQIQAVQGSTAGAVEAIRSIATRMHEIDDFTSAVAASVEQQNAATGEISQNVASAAQGTVMAASVLSEMAGVAGAARNSAETVLGASKTVEAAVANLRGEVESFLGKVAV